MNPTHFIPGSTIDFRVRNMVSMNRPKIDIKLNHHHGVHGNYITSYSTMDQIEGTATVTAKVDTRFEDLEVSFVGLTTAYVDKLSAAAAAHGRTNMRHRFVKLLQPIDEEALPPLNGPPGAQYRVLRAGQRLSFPFTFVVPQRMLPSTCSHRVENEHIHHAHLLLPPSLGDPELSGFGGILLDDLSPDMAKIAYSVQLQLLKKTETSAGKAVDIILAEGSRKVRLKPAFDEQPPLNIDEDPEYCGRVEKTINRGLFRGKMGRLVMQAEQPRSFRLPAPTLHNPNAANEEVSTAARIQLRFDPCEESSPPPPLKMLTAKLKVYTYFATAARTSIPVRSKVAFDMSQGMHVETLPLSQRCVAAVEWTKHAAHTLPPEGYARRESTLSTTSTASSVLSTSPGGAAYTPCASSAANPNIPYYTASILVPLALPRDKSLVPTFHTCLVSRIYSLSLHLDLAHSAGPRASLRLPVQISARAGELGEEARRQSAHMEDVDAEIERAMRPRSIAPPPGVLLGGRGLSRGVAVGEREREGRAQAQAQSSAAPPEYRVFDASGAAGASNDVLREDTGGGYAEQDEDEEGSPMSLPGGYDYRARSSTLSSGAVAVCG